MAVCDKSGFILARNSHWEVRVSMLPVVCISRHICALKYSSFYASPVTMQGFHLFCHQLVSIGCMKALRLFVNYLRLTGTLISICDREKLASGCENKNIYLSTMTWGIPVYPDPEVKSSSNVCTTLHYVPFCYTYLGIRIHHHWDIRIRKELYHFSNITNWWHKTILMLYSDPTIG